jgi:hypothetical protein
MCLRVLEEVSGEELVVDEAGLDVIQVSPEGALSVRMREEREGV